MALFYVDVYARCDYPIHQCDTVNACLTDTWLTRTNNGLGIVSAKVVSIGKTINPRLPYTNQSLCCTPPTTPAGCCPQPTSCYPTLGCAPTTTCPTDARLQYSMCIYNLEIDDSQFTIDPGTGEPYQPICSDFVDIMPYTCIIDRLITAVTP